MARVLEVLLAAGYSNCWTATEWREVAARLLRTWQRGAPQRMANAQVAGMLTLYELVRDEHRVQLLSTEMRKQLAGRLTTPLGVKLVTSNTRARELVEGIVASAVNRGVVLSYNSPVVGRWLTCSLLLTAGDNQVAVEVADACCLYGNAPFETKLTGAYAWR